MAPERPELPAPTWLRSKATTRFPLRARKAAAERPKMPQPTTATSAVAGRPEPIARRAGGSGHGEQAIDQLVDPAPQLGRSRGEHVGRRAHHLVDLVDHHVARAALLVHRAHLDEGL